MTKKICFAGLVSETNLGDVVILKATEHLYKEALPANVEVGFARLDIKAQSSSPEAFFKLKIAMMDFFRLNTRSTKINKLINDSKLVYRKQLHGTDLIVVVGGGLIKYKYQRFFIYLVALIEVAEELNIPIVLNSVGVEGYDSHDFRCQMLKKSLNKSIVKSVTTRDDIDLLQNAYMLSVSRARAAKASDPAVYADEVYQVGKQASKVIGVGLIRGGIFRDNHKDVSPDELTEFYCQLILALEQLTMPYQLFTNGLPADTELVAGIEARLGRKQLDVVVPQTDKQLVETIANFSVVIAARLHANIIAYALNVPSVGLVWNDKLKMFGQDIGYPDRFVQSGNITAKQVVATALDARDKGYVQSQWTEYKGSVKQHIGKITSQFFAGEL